MSKEKFRDQKFATKKAAKAAAITAERDQFPQFNDNGGAANISNIVIEGDRLHHRSIWFRLETWLSPKSFLTSLEDNVLSLTLH
jgi:hypothetical protein